MRINRGIKATLVVCIGGTMMIAGGISAVGAQEAATCEMTPLELPLFGGTPVAVLATPSPQAQAAFLPESQVDEVLQQYVACTNTGDPTLIWAVFTPRWFSQTFADPEEHYLPAFEQMLDLEGEPASVPLELVEIVEVEQTDDGRVGVTATFRSGNQEWTDKLTLIAVDGQWLIDEVELINPLP
jgi:hypothetical protein